MAPRSNKPVHLETVESTKTNEKTESVSQHDHGPAAPTLWKEMRTWRRVTLYCAGLTSAILLYGYDYVIVGSTSSMLSFQKVYGENYEGKWIIPSLWFGLWTFASPGASMIGAIIGGFVQDWVGRRVSLAIGSFVSAVGVAILFVSNKSDDINARRLIFLAGKALQGGAIGMIMATTQTYMSEILPPRLRGSILSFMSTFTLLGQLIGAAVIYACLGLKDGYAVCFATQWPFSALPLVMAFIIPESPTYLIRKGRFDKAYKSQLRLDSPGMDTQGTIELLRQNIERERLETRGTYMDCFKKDNIRRTMIIVFANFLPPLFGLTLLAKSSYFVQVLGMDPDLSIAILIIGIFCGFIANLASTWVVWRFHRRFLVLTSLSILVVLWFAVGITGIWSGPAAYWTIAILLILIIVVAGLGVWPCSYAISGETSSLELRAKSQGIGWLAAGAITSLFGFVLPYIFNTDQGNLGGKTGFIYAVFCAIALGVTYFEVPEMKGRSASEIDQLFEEKVQARHSKSWSASSTEIVL